MLSPHPLHGSARPALITLVCLGCVFASPSLQAQRKVTIVSVGDSVASGEGNPDVPQVIEPNLAFNPLAHTPNPTYNPIPELPNHHYNPFPDVINLDYNPLPRTINVNYQPFELPTPLKPLLPDFPPYDPRLTIPNPDYNPNLMVSNPNYDPERLVSNPNYDPQLFSDVPNPEFNDLVHIVKAPARWAKEEDHRSDRAGPALAAAELIAAHPDHDIRFFHRAKSGANISDIGEQIDAALLEVGGRIDVLMISAGGNDVGSGGFGALLTDAVNSLKTGVRPSQNVELNRAIDDSFAAMSNKFDRLAARIERCQVGEVFITEYFDLTRGHDGEFCLENEMRWAYHEVIVPLNDAIAAAAAEHGWHYVGGIAERFLHHGYCAARIADPRPLVLNPHFDPRPTLPNWDYHPIARRPNVNFHPVQRLPNPNYNPIAHVPNLNYDPRRNIANPNLNLNPLSPSYDPRISIPNPNYDPRLTVPNPHYDPNPTLPNSNYDPNPTLPNPDYDPALTVPNPSYDPDPTIPNPAFEPGIVVEENWVVRLEESFLIQGDQNGTAHPNRKGHEVYRDRLVEEILGVGLDTIIPCPGIMALEVRRSTIRFTLSSEHPVDALELQSTSDLTNSVWTSEPADLTDLGNHELETEIPIGSEGPEYFRLVVRKPQPSP